MKSRVTTIIAVTLMVTACKSETNNNVNTAVENKTEKVSKTLDSKSSFDNEIDNKEYYLCTIDDKPWSYTKASGIVSRHKKTNKREAIFTFTKQLEKGKEYIQLFYDGDTNELERISIYLKVLNKDGKRKRGMYLYDPNTMKVHPNAQISGTIDLSNPSHASGKAEVIDLNIRYDKSKLQHKEDEIISVKGIEFKGIGYSESGKLFGAKGNEAKN